MPSSSGWFRAVVAEQQAVRAVHGTHAAGLMLPDMTVVHLVPCFRLCCVITTFGLIISYVIRRFVNMPRCLLSFLALGCWLLPATICPPVRTSLRLNLSER